MIPSMHFSGPLPVCQMLDKKAVAGGSWDIPKVFIRYRVAELGSLSSGAKMAMKTFVKRVFTIFASNASFLRVNADLQN